MILVVPQSPIGTHRVLDPDAHMQIYDQSRPQSTGEHLVSYLDTYLKKKKKKGLTWRRVQAVLNNRFALIIIFFNGTRLCFLVLRG